MDERIETETDSQRIALHRVLREALTNINKHARAENVTVRLYEQEDVIYLQVSDDGIGFTRRSRRGAAHSLGLERHVRAPAAARQHTPASTAAPAGRRP